MIVGIMNKRTFYVEGWIDGGTYELGLPPDDVITVDAVNEQDAEDLGEKKLDKTIGKCDVIIATVCD